MFKASKTGTATTAQIREAHRLAGETGRDWRTCLRAVVHGPEAVRVHEAREAIREAMVAK